jgi:hypothetical protein
MARHNIPCLNRGAYAWHNGVVHIGDTAGADPEKLLKNLLAKYQNWNQKPPCGTPCGGFAGVIEGSLAGSCGGGPTSEP